jgi:hypothetical protein
MAGNEVLRRELDAAMKILEPAAYASRLAELQEQFGHRTVVLYFDGGPTHAALVREAPPQLVPESKWGPSELHSHGLWEVPASYGDQVRFYAPTDIEELLDLLFEKEGLND